MNIPNIKAIEYCVSELIKSKKIFFNNDGGYKLELKSIPQNFKTTPTQNNNNPTEKISKIAETTSNQKRPKTPTGKSKRKTFSFEFTKKLKNSLRRKTMSPTPAQNESKTTAQPPQFNTPRDIPLVDSGIDQSGISIGEFNPSMTSTASQVTTPNWSDSAQSSNPPDQYQTSTSPDQDYDSPLKLQKRQNQQTTYQQRQCPARYSDNESGTRLKFCVGKSRSMRRCIYFGTICLPIPGFEIYVFSQP